MNDFVPTEISAMAVKNSVPTTGTEDLIDGLPPMVYCGITPAGYQDALASGKPSLTQRLCEATPRPAQKLSLDFGNASAPVSATRFTTKFDLKGMP